MHSNVTVDPTMATVGEPRSVKAPAPRRTIGFVAGFVSATVGFAAPIALAAMAFGKYFRGVFDFGSPVVLSFVLVWIVALFHFGNLRLGSAFQNLWTIVKLFLISVLIGAGFLVEEKQPITFFPPAA